MHAIAPLRTLTAAARRGLGGAVLVAVLVLGVVAMHAMSGSVSHHGAVGTGARSSVEHVHAHAGAVATLTGHETAPAAPPACDAECTQELMTAMCLMVLVSLVTLLGPSRRASAVVRAALSSVLAVAGPRSRARTAPSLHALGILRT